MAEVPKAGGMEADVRGKGQRGDALCGLAVFRVVPEMASVCIYPHDACASGERDRDRRCDVDGSELGIARLFDGRRMMLWT